MSQDLIGKWYVYRYNLLGEATLGVLKDPETTLEISRQTKAGCLARFELRGWAEPVEIEMIVDDKTGEWRSKEEGSFLDFRWARVERGDEEPAMLAGQVLYLDDPEFQQRDFFVAVRSRRTYRLSLPEDFVYTFKSSYQTPFERDKPSEAWTDNISVHLSKTKNEILIPKTSVETETASDTFEITTIPYQGGLKIFGQYFENNRVKRSLGIWILPVNKPGDSGHLLATGYHEYHVDHGDPGDPGDGQERSSGINPICQRGLHLC